MACTDQPVVHGSYNQRDAAGTIIPWTLRTPRHLVITCLLMAGVVDSHRDVHAVEVPEGVYPPIYWSHIPAALALRQVLDLFDCEAIRQGDRVIVRRRR